MQARYYDPVIGRFMSNDPANYMDHLSRGNPLHGFNRYTYANNNPYKYTDPDGEFAFLAPLFTPAGIAAMKYTASTLAGILGAIAIHENVVEPMMNESSSGTENKGQTKPEVGDCQTCGGNTSNKPGKIGNAHGLKPKEVKDAIHGVKGNANLPNNPDVEVCNNCGEVFPQTEDGGLGDSIGNIEDEKGN